MPGAEFLVGERVSLRTFEEEDLPFLRDGVNDRKVWRSLGGQTLPSNLAQERTFFERLNRDDDALALVVTTAERRVGMVELDPIEWEPGRAALSFWIHPDHQGNGYATDAIRTLARYAFDHLRLHKLTAEAFAFNEGSKRVLDRVGFREEGVLRGEAYVDGDHVDVHRFGLLAGDRE